MKITHEAGKYVLYKEKTVIGMAALEDGRLWVEIDPAWRQRGYGSYLVKEILQQNGGYDVKRETRFTAGPAADEAAGALLKKFGFLPQGGEMVRRRVPDLSAVQLCHEFLTAHLQPGGLYVDATCGNGHDTEVLVLPALVRMENQVCSGRNLRKRFVQHTGYHAEYRTLGDGIADQIAAVQIENRGQIELFSKQAELRHIRDPFLIRLFGMEIPI